MTGIAVGELAGFEIEDPGERRDKEHLLVVARDFGIGHRHELADVRTVRAQRRALVQRLADRHEDARREPLAGDIADQEEEPAVVEAEEVVEVAAGFARRDHGGGDVDAAVALQQVGARQRRGLDPPRGFELARDAGALFALHLHQPLERSLLARGFRQREHEQHAEQQHQADRGRRRVEQQPLRPKRDEREGGGERDATQHEQRRVLRLPARRREHEPSAEQEEQAVSSIGAHAGRCSSVPSIEVLQQLRVDLAARHAFAHRRVLVFEQAESGDADQHQLPFEAGRIDAAFEDVDGRDEAVGPCGASSRRGPRHRSRSER